MFHKSLVLLVKNILCLWTDSDDTRTPPSCLADEWLKFSIDERKALYKYTLENTVAPAVPPIISLKARCDTIIMAHLLLTMNP